MRCQTVRKHLPAYSDAELPPPLAEALAAHLQTCPGCRQARARLQQLADLLSAAPARPVPEGFVGRVLAQARGRVAPGQAATPAPWVALGWRPAVSVPVRLAAAILVGLGISAGLVMGWQTGHRFGSAPPAADDPVVVYNLDCLGAAPGGSLPDAYLTLVSPPPGSGE